MLLVAVCLAWIGAATAQPSANAGAAAARATSQGLANAPTHRLALPARAVERDATSQPGSVLFIGTATVLLRYAGFTILTDPNFLHRGELADLGYGLSSPRATNPAMRIEDLPAIDLVVLSHFHGDHFDQVVQEKLARDTPIVTTPAAARALRKAGFTRVLPLRTWQTLEAVRGDARLLVTSMPGKHGPTGVAKAMPQTMGSLLEFTTGAASAAPYRIYISGDTLVFKALEDIPKRYPRIDLALLHLGGTRVFGVLVTMDATQGVQALQLLRPETAIPIHYDDYPVFKSPLADFVAAVKRAGLADKVRYLQRGESYGFTPAAR